jgi:hypothetical protein
MYSFTGIPILSSIARTTDIPTVFMTGTACPRQIELSKKKQKEKKSRWKFKQQIEMARTRTKAVPCKGNVGRRATRATSSFAESASGILSLLGTIFLSSQPPDLAQSVIKMVGALVV